MFVPLLAAVGISAIAASACPSVDRIDVRSRTGEDYLLATARIATYPFFLECGRQISPKFRTREALESPTTEAGIGFLERFRSEGRLLFSA